MFLELISRDASRPRSSTTQYLSQRATYFTLSRSDDRNNYSVKKRSTIAT